VRNSGDLGKGLKEMGLKGKRKQLQEKGFGPTEDPRGPWECSYAN
jgi:hypothetical protein